MNDLHKVWSPFTLMYIFMGALLPFCRTLGDRLQIVFDLMQFYLNFDLILSLRYLLTSCITFESTTAAKVLTSPSSRQNLNSDRYKKQQQLIKEEGCYVSLLEADRD